MREARMVIKGNDAFLKVVFEGNVTVVEPKESVAVDVNMNEIVVRKDDTQHVRISTRLADAHHWKSLAEALQRKYLRRWRENKRILSRIHSFHLKAKHITEDSGKKIGKWVVDVAREVLTRLSLRT